MNSEALIRLADLLEGKGPYEEQGPVPDDVFDMEIWGEDYEKLGTGECGFAGCALGWATTDRWFKERGLLMPRLVDGTVGEPQFMQDNGWTGYGFRAAASFFRISFALARHLFSPSGYADQFGAPSPAAVAARIRFVVDYNT